MLLGSLLGIQLARTASIGILSLILQDKNYKTLQMVIDVDIEEMEKSMLCPQDSLSSLAEVVLQIRRSLDLLFLQEKGLCSLR